VKRNTAVLSAPRPGRFIAQVFASLCLFLPLAACSSDGFARVVPISGTVDAGDRFMGVRLLGMLELTGIADGPDPAGLSGLAWDEDEGLLYAISDLGRIWRLQPRFESDRLVDAEVVGSAPFLDPDGQPLQGSEADAEGVVARLHTNGVRGDTRLLVSFEQRPRVEVYKPDGTWIESLELPGKLRSPAAYRARNKALEAIAMLPGSADPLLMPETPLRGEDDDFVQLFHGEQPTRNYPLHPSPGSSITAMEMFPDGRLLVLERAFVSPLLPFSSTLSWVDPRQGGNRPLDPDVVVHFNTADGWRIDNFEGLSRHRGQRIFLVSDDNNRSPQRTLLLYLELVPE